MSTAPLLRLLGVLALLTAAATAAPRNIVLIVADDHGTDLGCYGHPVIRTPHLDALAAEGTRFTHAFATTASCSASRSVILSGLHNHRTGQFGHTHDYHDFTTFDHVRGLPNLLREGGYRTADIGKFHVAPRSCYEFETTLPGAGRNVAAMGDVTVPDCFGNRPQGYEGVEAFDVDPADVIVPPFLPDRPETRAELAEYYRSVSRLDQGVGRLLEVLREVGVYDDTLIVYLSDHGIAFPGAKTTVYEPGLRAPLIVRAPGVARRGVVSDALVSWVDITPTLLDFAGVAPPTYDLNVRLTHLRRQMEKAHGLHGRSFLGLLERTSADGWDEVFASHTFHEIQMYYPMRAVRGRRYKLIRNLAHGLPFPFASDLWESPAWQACHQEGPEARYGPRTVRDYVRRPALELYDLAEDPHESTNLAGDPAFAELLADLDARLAEHQRRTADPWLLKRTYE